MPRQAYFDLARTMSKDTWTQCSRYAFFKQQLPELATTFELVVSFLELKNRLGLTASEVRLTHTNNEWVYGGDLDLYIPRVDPSTNTIRTFFYRLQAKSMLYTGRLYDMKYKKPRKKKNKPFDSRQQWQKLIDSTRGSGTPLYLFYIGNPYGTKKISFDYNLACTPQASEFDYGICFVDVAIIASNSVLNNKQKNKRKTITLPDKNTTLHRYVRPFSDLFCIHPYIPINKKASEVSLQELIGEMYGNSFSIALSEYVSDNYYEAINIIFGLAAEMKFQFKFDFIIDLRES